MGGRLSLLFMSVVYLCLCVCVSVTMLHCAQFQRISHTHCNVNVKEGIIFAKTFLKIVRTYARHVADVMCVVKGVVVQSAISYIYSDICAKE